MSQWHVRQPSYKMMKKYQNWILGIFISKIWGVNNDMFTAEEFTL